MILRGAGNKSVEAPTASCCVGQAGTWEIGEVAKRRRGSSSNTTLFSSKHRDHVVSMGGNAQEQPATPKKNTRQIGSTERQQSNPGTFFGGGCFQASPHISTVQCLSKELDNSHGHSTFQRASELDHDDKGQKPKPSDPRQPHN